MKHHLFIFLLLAILLVAGAFVFSVIPRTSAPVRDTIKIGGTVFAVEVADTPVAQTRGLSGHAPLGEHDGMLFVFPKKSMLGFWMKDVLFPLDMIWIADWRVVDISKNLPPDDSPNRAIYYPSQPADTVLEVPAGTADSVGLQIGDAVQRGSPVR